MKKIIYGFIGFMFLTLTSCSSDSENVNSSNTIETEKNYKHSSDELDLLDDINTYRVSEGLNPLQIIEHISFKSNEHNQYMISVRNVSHDGFSERKTNLQVVLGAARVGENVAYGYSSSSSTINAWIKSESHHANLVGNYTHFGISIKTDSDGKKYYTNMFIKK
jgi:uncharacterized protein YkwD